MAAGIIVNDLSELLGKPRRTKRQKESLDQKTFVKALIATGLGHFWVQKTMGTFDPVRKVFRKNTAVRGISDICGFLFKTGRAVFIEVKWVKDVDKKRKLVFKSTITDEQKEFLLRAHDGGCIAGIAFSLDDCMAIVKENDEVFPRHPRTYMFLPEKDLTEYVEKYKVLKAAQVAARQNPVTRYVTWRSS